MGPNSEIKQLVQAVSDRVVQFLNDEASIRVSDSEFHFHDVKRLSLDLSLIHISAPTSPY